MSRKKAPQHLNQFVGGLNTVESPLQSNAETSADELNILLNTNGSRQKRLGMAYEAGYVEIDTGIGYTPSQPLGKTTFRWEGAGGDAEAFILVIQIANGLFFFDASTANITNNLIHTAIFGEENDTYSKNFSYAVVDGILVVVNGGKQVHVFEYDSVSGNISESTTILYIRDLFGVQAYDDEVELTSPQYVERRPTTLTSTHLYNLRNQTWAIPRIASNTEELRDPIHHFYQDGAKTSTSNLTLNFPTPWRGSTVPRGGTPGEAEVFPSNSDNVVSQLKPDSADTQNRTIDRFFAADLIVNPLGSMEAPKGYFVIDALERGTSRLEQEINLRDNYPQLVYSVSDLPTDHTPGGPSVITEFAGRVWYGGFSGIVEGGDSKSPKLSSYVMFSSLVKDTSDIGRCYQEGDPTSADQPDLVDTDGGFIRVQGAYGINGLASLGNSLFVFAENGVWRISGQNDEPFRATDYNSEKISSKGCVSGNSIVATDRNILYWANDNIYSIGQDETGLWRVQNLTETTIQPTYSAILTENKQNATGFYDEFEQSVRWIYTLHNCNCLESRELVFYLNFAAFTKTSVPTIADDLPKLIGITGSRPYLSLTDTENVTVNGVDVTVNDVIVTSSVDITTSAVKETVYVILTNREPTLTFTIGKYINGDFYDWPTVSPKNYDSYLITQDITGGEPRTRKSSDFIYTYFRRTETGFDEDLNPLNPSSCLLSQRTQWSNSANSNRWSTPRQAYRYRKPYIPVDSSDTFDTGESVIWTRNVVRGAGKSLQLKFEAEEGKDLHLYGWSFNIESAGDDD